MQFQRLYTYLQTIFSFSLSNDCSLVKIQFFYFSLQKSCINFCIQAKPMEVYVPEETSGCLYHIWRLVTSPPFENFILFLIVLNTLLLMMKVSIQVCITEKNAVLFLNMTGNFAAIPKLIYI